MRAKRITLSARLVEIVTVDGDLRRYCGRFRALTHLEQQGSTVRVVEKTLARTRVVDRLLAVDVAAVRLNGKAVPVDVRTD